MDHRRQIAVILKQWLQMTRGESQAIRASDWAALRKVQGAKAELRQPLGRAFELWRAENPAEVASDPFRIEIAELLALEATFWRRANNASTKRSAVWNRPNLTCAVFARPMPLRIGWFSVPIPDRHAILLAGQTVETGPNSTFVGPHTKIRDGLLGVSLMRRSPQP